MRLRLEERYTYAEVDPKTIETTETPFILVKCMEREQRLHGVMYPPGGNPFKAVMGWCNDGKWRLMSTESVKEEIKSKHGELELPTAMLIQRPSHVFPRRAILRTDAATTRRVPVNVSLTGQRTVQVQPSHVASAIVRKVNMPPAAHSMWTPIHARRTQLPSAVAAAAGKLSAVKI